jgi:UPF0176 protein
MYDVMAFYAFASWPAFETHRPALKGLCSDNSLTGSILLAPEGVNGTVAGSPHGLEALLDYLHALPEFSELTPRYSTAQDPPFRKMKVRLKKEIVTLGIDGIDVSNTATHVAPADWDRLISDPDVVLVDTRNDYEIAIGSFPGAINPHTNSFGDFPAWAAENLKPTDTVAMFCTGGIRCEKATAYLKQQGFDDVYQLQGGILKYLKEIPAQDTNWQGECYVFDERVSVRPGLVPGKYKVCVNCNSALGREELTAPGYERGVTCPTCVDSISPERRARFAERQRQIELAEARGEHHLGP